MKVFVDGVETRCTNDIQIDLAEVDGCELRLTIDENGLDIQTLIDGQVIACHSMDDADLEAMCG